MEPGWTPDALLLLPLRQLMEAENSNLKTVNSQDSWFDWTKHDQELRYEFTHLVLK